MTQIIEHYQKTQKQVNSADTPTLKSLSPEHDPNLLTKLYLCSINADFESTGDAPRTSLLKDALVKVTTSCSDEPLISMDRRLGATYWANSLNIFPASLRSPCDQASLPIKIIASNGSQEAKYLAVPLLRGLKFSRLQTEIERISFDLTLLHCIENRQTSL